MEIGVLFMGLLSLWENTHNKEKCVKMKKNILTGFLCLSCLYMPNIALANDDEEEVIEVSDVNIYGEEYVPTGSTTTVTAEEIQMTPTFKEGVTDLFRGKSNIQFDTGSRNSSNAGEISPSKISINGAKYYENNFSLSGISTSNQIAVEGLDSGLSSYTAAPTSGNEQGLMVDTSLLSSVEIYTDNISAQYGDFVGGVVNATIKDAATDRWHGSIGYTYTSDELAEYFYIEGDEPDDLLGTNPTNTVNQPYFTKGNFTAHLEGPVWGNIAILGGYSNNHSSIPLTRLVSGKIEDVVSTRKNENFMLRVNTPSNEDFYLALTAVHAPYEAVYYSQPSTNIASFALQGGGTSFILNSHYHFPIFKWTNDIGYTMLKSDRDTDNVLYYANAPDNPDPGFTSGGFGYYEMNQDTISWKTVADFDPIYFGFENNFLTGLDMKYVMANSAREEFTVYNTNNYTIRYGIERKIDYFSLAYFAEDTMNIERFTVRPGARISYDTFMENLDIAPRLFANIDILNNTKYNIFGGYNRYSGTQLLNRSIYVNPSSGNGAQYDYNDVLLQTYDTDPTGGRAFADLKNPYSDELTVGASANVFDTLLKANTVYRQNKDQLYAISYKNDENVNTYIYTNEGESNYLGITFSAERDFNFNILGKHNMSLGVTWSEAKGNANSYTSAETDNSQLGTSSSTWVNKEYVYIDGKKVNTSDVSATYFNSPWIVTYNHSASFLKDDRLRVFAQVRWEQGGDRLVRSKVNPHTGVEGTTTYIPEDDSRVNLFASGQQENFINTDLSLELDILKIKSSTLTLETSIMNIFNKQNLVVDTPGLTTATTTSEDGSYALGRQFYLGGKYTF